MELKHVERYHLEYEIFELLLFDIKWLRNYSAQTPSNTASDAGADTETNVTNRTGTANEVRAVAAHGRHYCP